MLNRLILIGRLTKEPELRYTPSGVAVTNFTLAVDRKFKNAQGEREADFIPCVVYRQLAELCANYLDKGKLCSIDGRLQIRTYNDKDGQKRWVTECIGENVDFLSPKSDGSQQSTQQGQQQGTQSQQPPASQGQPSGSMPPPPGHRGAPPTSSYGREVNLDDDIPF